MWLLRLTSRKHAALTMGSTRTGNFAALNCHPINPLAGINKAFLQQHIQIEIALAFDT